MGKEWKTVSFQMAFIMWTTIGFAALGAMWAIAIVSLINMQKQIEYLYWYLEEGQYETSTQMEYEPS